ncbi:YnhF family membrane protein [Vibrio sp. S4M6]|nr:YnhF family membrane protein [Vibrio sinus]MCL9783601.1 YnhF family membrane protein [Vibrio sinus]
MEKELKYAIIVSVLTLAYLSSFGIIAITTN